MLMSSCGSKWIVGAWTFAAGVWGVCITLWACDRKGQIFPQGLKYSWPSCKTNLSTGKWVCGMGLAVDARLTPCLTLVDVFGWHLNWGRSYQLEWGGGRMQHQGEARGEKEKKETQQRNKGMRQSGAGKEEGVQWRSVIIRLHIKNNPSQLENNKY